MEEIGSVTVTVNGTDYVYPVLWDDEKQKAREFTDREFSGIRTITIGAFAPSGSTGADQPRGINLTKQLPKSAEADDAGSAIVRQLQSAGMGMQSITLYDAQSFANPLESAGMGGSAIEFTATGEDGVWAGTFEATLERQDPDSVEPGKPGTLEPPVAVEGFFTIELP